VKTALSVNGKTVDVEVDDPNMPLFTLIKVFTVRG